MGDLNIPLRGRTYRPPEGSHVAIARGRDAAAALEHVGGDAGCRGLALLGPLPLPPPDLTELAGRRLLVCSSDGPSRREWGSAGLAAGAGTEWLPADLPSWARLGDWALPVTGLVLAAGASSRMGRNKLLMDLAGRPLVLHAVEAAAEGGCHGVTAVYSEPAVAEAIGNRAVCVLNPDASSGQASSLRTGLQALPSSAEAAAILLGDQPLVGARTVDVLLRRWRREDARAVVASAYPGAARWQPPVVVARELWPELMDLQGDAGARQYLESRPDLVDTVDAGGLAHDVDTPEDYARILHLFPRSDPG